MKFVIAEITWYKISHKSIRPEDHRLFDCFNVLNIVADCFHTMIKVIWDVLYTNEKCQNRWRILFFFPRFELFYRLNALNRGFHCFYCQCLYDSNCIVSVFPSTELRHLSVILPFIVQNILEQCDFSNDYDTQYNTACVMFKVKLLSRRLIIL